VRDREDFKEETLLAGFADRVLAGTPPEDPLCPRSFVLQGAGLKAPKGKLLARVQTSLRGWLCEYEPDNVPKKCRELMCLSFCVVFVMKAAGLHLLANRFFKKYYLAWVSPFCNV